MEIDITDFFNNCAPMDYSASRAEIGDNAGQDTWAAAVEDAPDWPLLDTDEKRQAFREHAGDFGAWSDEEIAQWSDDELTALFIQMIAGDIREADLDTTAPDWARYQEWIEDGAASGRLYGGPMSTDGRIYYYLGT